MKKVKLLSSVFLTLLTILYLLEPNTTNAALAKKCEDMNQENCKKIGSYSCTHTKCWRLGGFSSCTRCDD